MCLKQLGFDSWIFVWFLLSIWVWLRGQHLEELILLQGLQFRRNPYIESARGLSLGVGPTLEGRAAEAGPGGAVVTCSVTCLRDEIGFGVGLVLGEMRQCQEQRLGGWVTPSSASNSGDNGKKARAITGNLGPILRKEKCHYTSPLSTATSFYSCVAPYFHLRNYHFSTWRGPYIPIPSLKR